MTPKQASNALRNIAKTIDGSSSVYAALSELRRLVVAIDKPFGDPPGSSVDERRQKDLERRQQKESEKVLDQTKKDIGKQVERLVEEEFKSLEQNMK